MNDQSDITKRLWPVGLPGTNPAPTATFQQFPNGAQLNQIWMDSLAKGMAQMENSYGTAPATDLSFPSPRPIANNMPKQQQHQGIAMPSAVSTAAPIPVMPPPPPNPAGTHPATAHPMNHHIQMQHRQQPLQSQYAASQQAFNNSSAGMNGANFVNVFASGGEAEAEAERKRKNREFAKRSREKRKNAQRLLEDELADLQVTNNRLRQIVQEELPAQAQSILKKCCADHPLHHAASSSGNKKEDALANSDFHLLENLIKQQQSFCLTDPAQPDNPIVYASENFYKLSGYSKKETLGRNCRFLQGKDTDSQSVAMIRESIQDGKDISVNLLNYKADGTPFWNQFFIAALRNRTGKIVNYVGVQCEIDEPKDAKSPVPPETISENLGEGQQQFSKPRKSIRIKGPIDVGDYGTKPDTLISEIVPNTNEDRQINDHDGKGQESSYKPLDISDPFNLGDEQKVDWSVLAGVLEDDFKDRMTRDDSFDDFGMATSSNGDTSTADQADDINDGDYEEQPQQEYQEYQSLSPRAFVTKTCRSELVDSLLSAHGDVTDKRFVKALEVLSSIYASYDPEKTSPEACIDNFLLNGAWVSLSRPAYGGCLGKNSRGDYMYTLGTMTFNMFKPADLKCSIQHTLNKIGFVCDLNEALNAVPWSLRRELAMTETDDTGGKEQARKILRSYDIEIAVTIEPCKDSIQDDNERPVGPKKPLRAVQVLKGYLLRDPNEKNRLTVWFTGGRLSPYTPPESADSLADDTEYGDFEDWKEIFDRDYKTSWSESFKNMGAMLFLGAELPQGMNPDGSMTYSLSRPYGGHGKGYIDVSGGRFPRILVLYVDEGLFITRGNYGTIHVGIRSSLLCPTLPDIHNSKDPVSEAPNVAVEETPVSNNKRKPSAPTKEVAVENGVDHSAVWRDALT
eukprot:scaffold1436_cov112-Cylindrotheca_fusiformis.AAC.1